jgi:hypothetical protein
MPKKPRLEGLVPSSRPVLLRALAHPWPVCSKPSCSGSIACNGVTTIISETEVQHWPLNYSNTGSGVKLSRPSHRLSR